MKTDFDQLPFSLMKTDNDQLTILNNENWLWSTDHAQ